MDNGYAIWLDKREAFECAFVLGFLCVCLWTYCGVCSWRSENNPFSSLLCHVDFRKPGLAANNFSCSVISPTLSSFFYFLCFLKVFFILYAWLFCLHICAPYVCLMSTRGCLIPRNYGWSMSCHVDTRNWTQVAGRATHALNCWTTSPGSQKPWVLTFCITVGKFSLTMIHYIFHKELEGSLGPKHKGMSMFAMQILLTVIWSLHMAYMCWVITLYPLVCTIIAYHVR